MVRIKREGCYIRPNSAAGPILWIQRLNEEIQWPFLDSKNSPTLLVLPIVATLLAEENAVDNEDASEMPESRARTLRVAAVSSTVQS